VSATDSPLSGLRVLDLTRVLAGPYVGRMLADLGAEVVKVEPPEGDVSRKWGRIIAGLSGYYTQQNVGKRGICVDLNTEAGPELIARLAEQADIVIENFRPGVLARYGLAYEQLRARNPRLVMASISGFGQDGPEAQRPAYAAVAHAESGIVHRQAHIDGAKPTDLRVSVADMNAALHALVGLLAAVVMRQRTGRGQHVDIAMVDTMVATDDYVHLALDGVREEAGVVVNEVWDVVGGPILIAGDFRWIWRQLHETHGLKDPTPEGASIEVKSRCRHQAVADFFAGFDDRGALLQALSRANLAVGEIKPTSQALQSTTLEARGSIASVSDRAGGSRRVVQSPYRYSDAQSGANPEGAPRRGEHNWAVLRAWLSLPDDEIAALETAGTLLSEA